jgi:hypothetical protein
MVQGKALGSGAQPEHLLAAVLEKAFAETTGPTCSDEGCSIQP